VPAPERNQRAEHASLTEFLESNLSANQRQRVGLLAFHQWPWVTAAFIEIAVAFHQIGAETNIGFWADDTPLPDPGWSTSRRISRLTGSHTIEASAVELIKQAGVSSDSFTRPPLRRHSPRGLPVLPTPLTRAAVRSLDYQGSGMGRSILQVHPDFATPIRDDLVWPRRWIRRAVESYAWVYDQTRELIQRHDLQTILVFNGRFTHDRAAAAAAEALGVNVLYYDYGGIETYFDVTLTDLHDWDDLQERMLRMWEQWGDGRDEVAHAWFANRENRSEPGMDLFLSEQDPHHLPPLPEGHQIVAFFSSSGDEIAELDLEWSRYFESQEGALRTLAAVVDEMPNTTLVVRTHPHMRLKPQDDRDRWVAAVEAIGRNIHVAPESPTDSYALMRTADRVITYGSTSGIEAAYRGKPTATMGPAAYQLLGCVTPLATVDELRAWLHESVATHPERALPYGLMMQRRGFNLRWLREDEDGTIRRGDVDLREAKPLAQKASHVLGALRKRWLTAR